MGSYLLQICEFMLNHSKQNQQSISRTWTAYEKNQLLKYGFKPDELKINNEQPVEYITGFAPFYGYDFKVSQDVLIPRVESEGLVSLALGYAHHWRGQLCHAADMNSAVKTPMFKMADVGTGSGNLGLSCLLSLLPTKIKPNLILSDISSAALTIARQNLQRLVPAQTQSQVRILVSDLLTNYPNQPLDLIMANLPYVPQQYLSDLPDSVARFEPIQALNGGQDGLLLIRDLISQTQTRLAKTGLLILEIDARAVINRQTLGLDSGAWHYRVVKDNFDQPRYLLLGRHQASVLKQIASKLQTS